MSEAQTTVRGPAPSDAELIASVRAGDNTAFAALYERHAVAARSVARSYLPPADADDAVGDAFTRVLDILRSGGGPEIAFRAYLFTIVRRLCHEELTGARRTAPTSDEGTFESALGPLASTEDPALAGLERSMVVRAFRSLPERWQAALWYTEVEDMSPARLAPLLGLSANGVAALAYRAREGLRQAYLREHLARAAATECAEINPLLAPYVRDGLSRRERVRVDEHLADCVGCSAVVLELGSVAHGMRGMVAPLVLGAGALGLVGHALPIAGGAAVGVGAAGALAAAGGTSGTTGAVGGAAAGAAMGAAAGAAAGIAAGELLGGATGGGTALAGATAAGGAGPGGAAGAGGLGGAAGSGAGAAAGGAGAAGGATGFAAVLSGSPVFVVGVTLGVAAVTALGVAGLLGAIHSGSGPADAAASVTATTSPGADATPARTDPEPPGPSPSALPDPTSPTVPTAPTGPGDGSADPSAPGTGPTAGPPSTAGPTPGGDPSIPTDPQPAPTSIGGTPTGPPPGGDPGPGGTPVLSLTLDGGAMAARVPSALEMTAANTGAAAAEQVEVGITLPAGIESPTTTLVARGSAAVATVSAAKIPCGSPEPQADGTSLVTCDLGTLPAGTSQPLELAVVADSGGAYSIAGAVWARGVAPIRQTFAPTSVSYFGPQVRVDRVRDVALANPGAADVSVPVRNSGDQPATGVGVTFTVPAGLGVTGRGGWSCQGSGTVTCTSPAGSVLGAGARANALVSVYADGSSAGGDRGFRVRATTPAGPSGASRAVGVTVEAPWAGIDTGPATISCVGPAEPGRTARITATVTDDSTVAESLTLVTAYGSSETRTLPAGRAGPVRVQLPAPGAPWTPAGTATVVVQRTAAGTVYTHEIPAPYPAADCYVPAWDTSVAVVAAWSDGSIHVTGTLRNDTAEAMTVQMISGAYGGSDARTVAPGDTAAFVVDAHADALPAGTVTFALGREVGGRSHTATVTADYAGAAYVPDWRGAGAAALTCGSGTAVLAATWTNTSAEPMTVAAQAPWDAGPARVVGPGASVTFTASAGSLSAPGGRVTFTLSRAHATATYTAQATADFGALDCTVRAPAASLAPGPASYDDARDHSYRPVSVVLDNTGSNVPVAFAVTGGTPVAVTVPAGQSATVALGEAPWSGAAYVVTADGWAAPVMLTVDPFTAAPACLPAWSPAVWYDHTASASYRGWNYDARNSGIAVPPEGEALSLLFWERTTRCGAG